MSTTKSRHSADTISGAVKACGADTARGIFKDIVNMPITYELVCMAMGGTPHLESDEGRVAFARVWALMAAEMYVAFSDATVDIILERLDAERAPRETTR